MFRLNATRTLALTTLTALGAVACDEGGESTPAPAAAVDPGAMNRAELEALLQQFLDERAQEDAHLATFDALDFEVFSDEKWARLGESHAQDVIVHWPDGRVTEGIDVHIEDLKWLFVWAPDTRIKEHPIRLGNGDFTAVAGFMEGTFTEPMPMPDGSVVQPTGKAYRIAMATIAQWENGTMREEWLYWDNQDFFNQIGLGGQ